MKPIIHTENLWRQILPIMNARSTNSHLSKGVYKQWIVKTEIACGWELTTHQSAFKHVTWPSKTVTRRSKPSNILDSSNTYISIFDLAVFNVNLGSVRAALFACLFVFQNMGCNSKRLFVERDWSVVFGTQVTHIWDTLYLVVLRIIWGICFKMSCDSKTADGTEKGTKIRT